MEQEIKELIINTLALEDIREEDIDTDAPLFVDGLGLDSIDALELGVAIQKTYGIKINASHENTKEVFSCVRTLAKFVKEQWVR